MKNARVVYRVDATVNLGDFENVKPGLTLESDVEDGQDPKEVIRELAELADSFITHQYNEAKNNGIG